MEGEKLKEAIAAQLAELVETDEDNSIGADKALVPEACGLRMFDPPLVGVASADDPLFVRLREPQAIGPHVRMPGEWLEGARSVVSYFFPMSEQVRVSNRGAGHASPEWFHARIDGQAFVAKVGGLLVKFLRDQGWEAVCPAISPDFSATFLDEAGSRPSFTTNWSERHAAYVAGLGTFSLTKGLITERGMAGRFGSVITTAPLPVTQRAYEGIYEYCIRCGSCIPRCPVGAISLEDGKDNYRCYQEMGASRQIYAGYVGCGKCQTGVPCEFRRP